MTESASLAVRGEATILAEPELATVSITVEAQGSNQRAALDLLSRRARAVADLVAQYPEGIERTETSRLHVYPELDPKKTEKVRRYLGRTTTTVVVHDFAVLSDLVVGSATIDLASVSGPWWALRDNSAVFRQARLAATADALHRARDYAAAFGASLVGLVEIADEGMSQQTGQVQPMMARFAMNSSAGGGEPEFDLEPEQQEVRGQVEARFLLSQPNLSAPLPAEVQALEADGQTA